MPSSLFTYYPESAALLTEATRIVGEDSEDSAAVLTVVVMSGRETVKIAAPLFDDSDASLASWRSRVPDAVADALPPFVDDLKVDRPFVVVSTMQLYGTTQAAFVRGRVWVLVQATGVSEPVASVQLLSVEGVDGEPDRDRVVPSPSRSWFSMEYDVTDAVRYMT